MKPPTSMQAHSVSLLAILAGALVLAPEPAWSRTAQVCPGPQLPPATCFTVDTSVIGGRRFEDFSVNRPGKLLVDVDKRRAELAALGGRKALDFCAVNPLAAEAASLPTVTFASAAITVWETRYVEGGQQRVREYAQIAFTDLRNSEGIAYPRFGLTYNRQRDEPVLRLELFPSTDPNLRGIAGMADVYLNADTAGGTARVDGIAGLPAELRSMVLALARKLPDVVMGATQFTTQPGASSPLWDRASLAASAGTHASIVFSVPQPTHPPIVALTCSGTECMEQQALGRFRDFMSSYGSDFLATGNPAIARQLLDHLRSWAAADALSAFPGIVVGQPNQEDFRQKYEILWSMLPVLQTWSMLRHDPLVMPTDRVLIDRWFDRLVAFSTEPPGGIQNGEAPFNTGYLSRGMKMAWGIVQGDRLAVAEGMEKVVMGLHQMRADGSFPREVARGACAYRYQDTMLLNLVFIAELAAVQGYDAYALAVDGKSLHTAVKFLLDAVDNPALMRAYAGADASNCSNAPAYPDFDMVGVVQAVGGSTYSAWLEAYGARFPDHPNSVRLAQLIRGGVVNARPLTHPHAGGNASCFHAGTRSAAIALPNAGWWWNRVEDGRGFAITPHGDGLLLSAYLFDAAGQAVWYAAPLENRGGATYAGTLLEYRGGQTLGGPYKPPAGAQAVGSVTVSFSTGHAGVLTWAGGSVPIERFDFGSGGARSPQPLGEPETGVWWDPTENGRGFVLEVQDGVMVLGGYMYEDSGRGVWYGATLTSTGGAGRYLGTWAQYAFGQSLGGAYRRPVVGNANVGQVTLEFSSTTSAVLSLPSGRRISISRFRP
ncbi:hypothetical protein FN976_17385 [Caenimonas sedimenti]|uniref:Alginate lyase domain-containing protein n=1 Tax=Caenimonas sedimenti TaxID=2596921 RepID=A0A562ZP57_9BURK|nr:alginate lyase family protein [Caenimonas sedimenti]TWO70108.1 hypothetical protein FN976_17385 [Caenimonas sedimenti]